MAPRSFLFKPLSPQLSIAETYQARHPQSKHGKQSSTSFTASPANHSPTPSHTKSLNLIILSTLLLCYAPLEANMSTTQSYYPSYPSGPVPINMPQKGAYYYPHPQYTYGRVSGSPPEAPESVTTSGVHSYEPSATSSSYAGSASDYDSSGTTAGVDLMDYMGDRLNGSFNPTPLDRSLARQAQT